MIMSACQLSAVLVNALSDEGFRENLLDSPDQALTRFDLSPDELHALSYISTRANTIEEFAMGMVSWLSSGQSNKHRVATAVASVSG
jgi:hypothetical protein